MNQNKKNKTVILSDKQEEGVCLPHLQKRRKALIEVEPSLQNQKETPKKKRGLP